MAKIQKLVKGGADTIYPLTIPQAVADPETGKKLSEDLTDLYAFKNSVVDNLTSTDTEAPLSANQGRVLSTTKQDNLEAGTGISISGNRIAATGEASSVSTADGVSYDDQNGDFHFSNPSVQTAIEALAKDYLYAGVAKLTPTQTNPGSPDANVFYIATEPGTYTNFIGAGGSLVVADGEVAIFKFNGTWSKEVTGAVTAAQINELGQNCAKDIGEIGYFNITKERFTEKINFLVDGSISYDSASRLSTLFYSIKSGTKIIANLPCPSSSFNVIFFDDSGNIIINESIVGRYGTYEIIVPEDAAFVRFSCQTGLVDSVSVSVQRYGLAKEVLDNTEQIEEQKELTSTILPYALYRNGDYYNIPTSSFINGVRVDAKTGVVDTPSNYASTDYINVEKYRFIEYLLPFSGIAGIAFYDYNKNIISKYGISSSSSGFVRQYIPNGVKYIRLTRRTDDTRTFYGALYLCIDTNTRFAMDGLLNSDRNNGESRIIQEREYVFTNHDLSYTYNGETYYYTVSMPNHQILNDGTIVVVAELFYTDERGSRAGLGIRRSIDGGKTWNNPIYFEGAELTDNIITDNDGGGNPVFVYNRQTGELFLFYQPQSYRKSTDGGENWGEKISISSLFSDYSSFGCYASPCNGIQLTNGIIALAYRIVDANSSKGCVVFSRDNGITWEKTVDTSTNYRVDEFALAEYKANTIMLNARAEREISQGYPQMNRRVLIQSNPGSSNKEDWTVTGWELEENSDLKIIDGNCQGSFIRASINGNIFGLLTNIYCKTAYRENLLMRVSSDFIHWSVFSCFSAINEEIHGYSSMCCINNNISICSEDKNGIWLSIFCYEFIDKLLRIFAENKLTYME